jgi:hypothetical protein
VSSLIDVELRFVALSILPLNWAVKVCGSLPRRSEVANQLHCLVTRYRDEFALVEGNKIRSGNLKSEALANQSRKVGLAFEGIQARDDCCAPQKMKSDPIYEEDGASGSNPL